MKLWLDLFLGVASLPSVLSSGYLLGATLLSRKPRTPDAMPPTRRFRFVVPAHNESAGIASTVASLLSVDYPKELFEVVVVADNCSDDTADRARAAGASVLERKHDQLRGKGYALHYAFEQTPAEVDALVVIDADTLVSPNILRAFAARRERGANAVQADYAVRNPHASWRTRLIAVAFGSFHIVRSRAREALALSCGLRGNGMCFSRELLQEVPHDAFSVVEDVEYGIRLGEAGHRVHYADEAHVYGEMVSTAKAAASQRRRWEEGRRDLVRRHAKRLLRAGIEKRDRVLFDLGLDLIIPPLSRLAMMATGGLLASAAAWLLVEVPGLGLVAFGFSLASLGTYVFRGWMVSNTGARGLFDLAFAPVYVLWKAGLRVSKPERATSSWVRTKREEPSA